MNRRVDMKEVIGMNSRPLTMTVTSGKGGVGKSIIALSLAVEYASKGIRTLLVDADLGLGNLHLLTDQSPVFTFEDVLTGSCELHGAVLQLSDSLNLLPARSGFADVEWEFNLSASQVRSQLKWLRQNYDLLVFDSGAGISSKVITVAKLTDLALIVTTPEIAAVADSYAVAKYLLRTDPASTIGFVVNRAESEQEGKRTGKNLQLMIRKFLGYDLADVAHIREHHELNAISLSRKVLGSGFGDDEWGLQVKTVCRILPRCLPDDLSLREKTNWGTADILSRLNFLKGIDDTSNVASEAGDISGQAEYEALIPRKDSL